MMREFPFCLPILSPSREEVIERVRRAADSYPFFEIWLDYLEGDALAAADQISAELGGRAIFLFRRQSLEPIRLPIEDRKAILTLLSERQSLIDLDVTIQGEEVEFLRSLQKRPQTILSFHDYSGTPPDRRLRELIAEMDRRGASIVKIACNCKSESDALRLLNLLLELRNRGLRYIVLGMGEHGIITRVFGTLWGNALVFAPERQGEGSAPGQLARAELEQCLRIVSPQEV